MIQALLRSACEAVNEAVAPFHETLKDVQYACGWHEPGEDKPCGVTVTKRTLCEHLSSAHSVGKKKKSKGRFMCRWLCGVAHEPHETNLNNLSKHIAAVHLQHAKPLSTTLAPNPKPFCEERKVVGTQGGKQVVEYHEVGEGGVKTRKTMEVKMPVVYMLTDIRTDLMERHAWFQVVAWVVEKWLNPMEEE
ncbi:hypothetical protein BKA70DRAFT_1293826 [Coprinopsis sp. MPI-PUGE-AT-0042]|nr:hypothetical protein BKA70DRAFT_1293826 [Coprinopsis sp. MPI-PUGE-AT-0042]